MEGNQFFAEKKKRRKCPDVDGNGELMDGCDLENVSFPATNNFSSLSKCGFY
jgi:hypothetical protein